MRETEDRLRGVSETHSNIDPGHGGPWPETGDHTHCVQTSISDIQDTDSLLSVGKCLSTDTISIHPLLEGVKTVQWQTV